MGLETLWPVAAFSVNWSFSRWRASKKLFLLLESNLHKFVFKLEKTMAEKDSSLECALMWINVVQPDILAQENKAWTVFQINCYLYAL